MTPGTSKRMFIMLGVVAVIGGGVAGFHVFKSKMIAQYMKGMSNPPQTVATAVATSMRWQPSVEALGSLRASRQSSLSAEVGGLVTAIHFDSGAQVRAGQALVELNPAPVRAQLLQAQAEEQLAAVTLKRDRAQLAAQAISQAVVDTDSATLQKDQATVEQQQALLAQHTIAAPFAGRLGIRQVDLGQYLAPGAPVVTLQQLNPMFVDFTVPQSQIDLIRVGMKAQVRTDALAGQSFDARVTAIEPQVDTNTRNLKVRAEVANPDGKLLPGVFASVRIDRGAPQDYLTLPNAAITYNPYGETVYVVQSTKGADGKQHLTVEQRFVTVGPTRGDQVAVLKGLKAGETVVTAGQLKLRNGTPVVVDNSVKPSDDAHPHVPNS